MPASSTSEETRSMPAILSAENIRNEVPPTHAISAMSAAKVTPIRQPPP